MRLGKVTTDWTTETELVEALKQIAAKDAEIAKLRQAMSDYDLRAYNERMSGLLARAEAAERRDDYLEGELSKADEWKAHNKALEAEVERLKGENTALTAEIERMMRALERKTMEAVPDIFAVGSTADFDWLEECLVARAALEAKP